MDTHAVRILLPALLLAGLANPTAALADGKAALATLPDNLRGLYVGAEQNVQPSAFDGFAMPAKPWKWCHSESYQGNPWRVALTNHFKSLVGAFQADGSVSSFELSDSNGDTSQQIAQLRAFIDKKCSVITVVAGSSTALNDAIEAAYKAGIPVVSVGLVTTPYAVSVDSNYIKFGYDMAKDITTALNGKGNVLRVEGIAGSPLVAEQRVGADKGFAESPDVKVVRDVNGNWTAAVTKTVVLQALATNPGPIDAVWTSGSEARVVAEAFAQAGRPAPVITGSISGDALGYWKAHPDFKFTGGALLPSWTAQTAVRVGVRMLLGQEPKVSLMEIPIPDVKVGDLGSWYRSCMTADAVSVFPVAPQDPMPEDLMNGYFKKPAPTPEFDYAKTPDPCAQ
ncbi:substrate-binding domain-containing protein [Mesorhizobium sp. B2-4-6]|uniref:substrate-binding domain-containing protein n=1 Tax=Mesorhizobium sp. B2-4-6 TaxID=2589943 RepID=UPI001128DE4B|nr:substrate-binding domain-containing protein [Mesorhizobium sp. B2-4-6]TPL51747.1 substrate-binding domain-containing protein [Mesorhizobium sp. B2-4-6]